MTNGEAARKLFDIKHDEHFSWTQESVDAFDMAISALFDLAISSLEKHPDESSDTRKRPKWANSIRDALLFPCQSTLEMLPDIPATGAPEECEDAVSRKAAVEEIRRYGVGSFDFEDYTPEQAERFVIKLLQGLPSVMPEPCEDAVSRQRLLNDLKELKIAWEKYPVMAEQIKGVEVAIEYVEKIPYVTPKRKTGKWIEHSFSEDGKTRLIECSECGAAYIVNCLCDYSIFIEERRYCNKCGAKMEGFRLTFVEEQNCEGHVECSAYAVYSDVPSEHEEGDTNEHHL